jgi:hypothetical protein
MTDSIISTPYNFPKVEPSDWGEWWNIWRKNSKTLWKLENNHNSFFGIGPSYLKGFDIYINDSVKYPIGYHAPYVDCKELFFDLFNFLDLLPIDVKIIKAVSSFKNIAPHKDWEWKEFSIRSLLYDSNPLPNFYYIINDKKIYQRLPRDTNTWGYWDHKVVHGSDYFQGYEKILLMYYGPMKKNFDIKSSIEKYKEYIILDNV